MKYLLILLISVSIVSNDQNRNIGQSKNKVSNKIIQQHPNRDTSNRHIEKCKTMTIPVVVETKQKRPNHIIHYHRTTVIRDIKYNMVIRYYMRYKNVKVCKVKRLPYQFKYVTHQYIKSQKYIRQLQELDQKVNHVLNKEIKKKVVKKAIKVITDSNGYNDQQSPAKKVLNKAIDNAIRHKSVSDQVTRMIQNRPKVVVKKGEEDAIKKLMSQLLSNRINTNIIKTIKKYQKDSDKQ